MPGGTRVPWWRTWLLPVAATPVAVLVGLAIGLVVTRGPGRTGAVPAASTAALAVASSAPAPSAKPALSAKPAPSAAPTPAAAIAGRWSTCAAMDDSLTIEAGGTATYTGSPQGGPGEATLRITAPPAGLVAVVERSTVSWLPVGQVNDLTVSGDRMVATVGGKNPWYLFRWGAPLSNVPDGPCGQ